MEHLEVRVSIESLAWSYHSSIEHRAFFPFKISNEFLVNSKFIRTHLNTQRWLPFRCLFYCCLGYFTNRALLLAYVLILTSLTPWTPWWQVNSFALCLSHSGQIFHYLLDMNTLGQLSIENGRKFENLLQVVDHYSRTPDGLLRALGEVCPVNIFSAAESESRVRHGPLRIDETEISVKGELGEFLLYYFSSIWTFRFL